MSTKIIGSKISASSDTKTKSKFKTVRVNSAKSPKGIYNKKEWSNYKSIDDDIIILRGSIALTDHRFGYLSRGKQGSVACSVAPAFAKLYPVSQWSSADLDKILGIADKLYKTTVQKQKLKNGSHIKPNCIFPSFFIDLTKVNNFIGGEVFFGVLDDGNSNVMEFQLSKFLETNDAAILYSAEKYSVMWKTEEACFCFCSDYWDGNEELTLLKKEVPCLIKSNHLHRILELIHAMLSAHFALYSLKIMKVNEVCRTYSDLFLIQQNVSLEKVTTGQNSLKALKFNQSEEIERDLAQTNIKSLDTLGETAFCLPSFSAEFSKFDDARGSLTCNACVDDPNKIPCANIASLLFLQEIKSYFWTSETLIDIIALGNSIYEGRGANHIVGNWDFIQELQIHFANKTLKMETEKVIFGAIQRTKVGGCDLKSGLESFLKKHSFGLLQAPQSVAVWKEGSIYFMFDAKERDCLGRKWTKLNSSSLGDEKPYGSACLTWFKNLKDLVELYISNIPPKKRSESFRILRVNFIAIDNVPESWNTWLALQNNAWILRGYDSVCDYTRTISQRISHGLCVTVIACVYSSIKSETIWTPDTINELIHHGFDLYKTCLESHNSKDPLLFRTFSIPDLKRYAKVEERNIEFSINEYAVVGFVLPTSDQKFDLVSGLKFFFTGNTAGILVLPNEYLAVWTSDGVFYKMDPFERDSKGMNPTVCHTPMKLGTACAMRFNRLEDMANLILANIVPTRSCEYHIASLTCTGTDIMGKPSLKNYEEFTSDGAILRMYGGHNGHSPFDSTTDNQTFCSLLAALGFSHINKPTGWSKEDIVDIIRNGDRMYYTMLNGQAKSRSTNLEIGWETLGDSFRFGGSEFYYSRAEQNGVFIRPFSTDDENVIKDIQTSDTKTKSNENVNLDKVTNSNVKEKEKTKDLASILSDWKQQESVGAILQSNLFDITLWKEEGLYFIFDPKASDFDGALTPRRLFIASNKIGNKNRSSGEETENYVERYVVEQEAEDGFSPETSDVKDEKTEALQRWSEEIERNVAFTKQMRECENEGSAYVAWFVKFESFVEHILSKVPKEFTSEQLTLNTINIKAESIYGKDDTNENEWNAFRSVVSGSHWIIRATISQNDPQFPNKKNQDAGNCIMSLAFALMCPPNKYSSTLLDIILKYGDRLYMKSIVKLRNSTETKAMCDTRKLELKDLIKSFSVYKYRFHFQIRRKYTGVLNRADNIHEPNEDFHEAISELGAIANNEGGILVYKNYYVAIWKTMDSVFMFDPHPTSPHGSKSDSGMACLSRVASIDDLFKAFLWKFECVPGLKIFEFHTVEIKKYLPDKDLEEASNSSNFPDIVDENTPKPELTNFEQIYKGVRVLRAVFQNDVVSQLHTCLAALVFKDIVLVEYWTAYILNQITYLGFRLSKKSGIIRHDSEVENEASITEAIIRDFKVNNADFHVDLGDGISGPITSTADAEIKNLRQSLTLLLKYANKVILKIKNLVMSIWMERDVFYMFYVNPMKKECNVIAADKLEFLCSWLEENARNAGVQNLYEIRTISLHKTVEKTKCKANIPWQTESTLNSENTKSKTNFLGASESRLTEMDTTELQASKKKNVLGKASEYLRASTLNEQRPMAGSSFFFQGLKGACLVAAGMAHIRDISEWNSQTLDAIMEGGMLLYMNSLEAKQTDELEITDLEQNVHILNVRMQIVALLPTQEIPRRENILPVIQYALEDYKCTHITMEHKYFTVMKQHDKTYLFDPDHIIYSPRLDKWSRVASLLKFDNISSAANHILRTVKNKSGRVGIGPIVVCIRH